MKSLKKRYPRTVSVKDGEFELSLLLDPSQDDVSEFIAGLPEHDLLFLSRDIAQPKVLEAWRDSIAAGDIIGLAARRDGKVLGTTAVVVDKLSWSPHVGDLRVLVAPEARDTGLGRELIQESFLLGLELGLEKLTVRMTLDQESAISVFEDMGFKSEALLKDHVKDRAGQRHDLLLLAHDVEAFAAQRRAYGIDEAF